MKAVYHGFMKIDSSNSKQDKSPELTGRGSWDFLTNHAHVLLCVAGDSGIRVRDIAAAVGITERSAHKILSELVEEGYVQRERRGRQNHYEIRPRLHLRHPLVQEREVGDLLKVLLGPQRLEENGRPARKRKSDAGGPMAL